MIQAFTRASRLAGRVAGIFETTNRGPQVSVPKGLEEAVAHPLPPNSFIAKLGDTESGGKRRE